MQEILANFDVETITGAFAGGIAAALIVLADKIYAKVKGLVLKSDNKIDDLLFEAVEKAVDKKLKEKIGE